MEFKLIFYQFRIVLIGFEAYNVSFVKFFICLRVQNISIWLNYIPMCCARIIRSYFRGGLQDDNKSHQTILIMTSVQTTLHYRKCHSLHSFPASLHGILGFAKTSHKMQCLYSADYKVTHNSNWVVFWCVLDRCLSWLFHLHRCDQDKMTVIGQRIFSNAFSWIKIIAFWFKLHCNLLPMVRLTMIWYWFR